MSDVKVKGRPCGPLKSKKNPDAYTKPELVKLATKKFGITASAANKLTKDQICTSLLKGKVVEKAKAKSTKKVVAKKVVKKTSTKEKVVKKTSTKEKVV
ncbi:MAG TPA: hypothetical protein PKD85_01855, partial [Saprospiraceae bacterium]|nr:hypothetical protein [Saprospiraceae bacterium]